MDERPVETQSLRGAGPEMNESPTPPPVPAVPARGAASGRRVAEPAREAVAEARSLHQCGRLDEAIAIYDALLRRDPDHAEALHLRGVAAHQRGDHARAVELIGRAVALAPDEPAYLCNLADAERGLGRLADAEAHCRAALAVRPDYPAAL